MPDVILSIHPKYAELILSGKKTVELRKRIWKKMVRRVYLYATKPIQKLLGYFEILDTCFSLLPSLWKWSQNYSYISRDEFDAYYNGHTSGIGIVINFVEKFKEPIDPFALDPQFTIPQNFCYVSRDLEKKLNKIEV